jgi:hypothetical protein
MPCAIETPAILFWNLSCSIFPPSGNAVGVLLRITLGLKRPLQKGIAKRDEALSPKVHYTKHNVPDEAKVS